MWQRENVSIRDSIYAYQQRGLWWNMRWKVKLTFICTDLWEYEVLDWSDIPVRYTLSPYAFIVPKQTYSFVFCFNVESLQSTLSVLIFSKSAVMVLVEIHNAPNIQSLFLFTPCPCITDFRNQKLNLTTPAKGSLWDGVFIRGPKRLSDSIKL